MSSFALNTLWIKKGRGQLRELNVQAMQTNLGQLILQDWSSRLTNSSYMTYLYW